MTPFAAKLGLIKAARVACLAGLLLGGLCSGCGNGPVDASGPATSPDAMSAEKKQQYADQMKKMQQQRAGGGGPRGGPGGYPGGPGGRPGGYPGPGGPGR
jgi:hypothetical protein